MNRQIAAPAHVRPRDDQTKGQQFNERIYDRVGYFRASMLVDDPLKSKGDDINNTTREIDVFSSTSTSREENLAWGKFDEEALERQVPWLGPLCLENDSCGRRRRKHQRKLKRAPVDLSSSRVDFFPCHPSNPSQFSRLVLQQNSSPGVGNTPESPLQPESFQYLLEFLETKAHTRGMSRSAGAPLYNLAPASSASGPSRPRS